MITTMENGKGKYAYMYCVIEDVKDNDPDKYKWWPNQNF